MRISQDTAAAVAAMSKQLTDLADEMLPGKDGDRPGKPSAPLRQRLQQSWQGKVCGPDSDKWLQNHMHTWSLLERMSAPKPGCSRSESPSAHMSRSTCACCPAELLR